MTRVCLVGTDDLQLSYELLSRETAREALAAYDLHEPYHNTVAVETVSLGAAVALLNDLDWYLVRFVREAMVLEPSVSDTEWLSRKLATAIRDGVVDPEETGRLLKVYGLASDTAHEDDGQETGESDDREPREAERPTEAGDGSAEASDGSAEAGDGSAETGDRSAEGGHGSAEAGGVPRLVEPMFVARTGGGLPEYDLRDVDETLLVRVTDEEFSE
jgi:hypothetical protein